MLARLGLAAAGGALVYFSYEPFGLWWLGIAGCAVGLFALAPWRQHSVGYGQSLLIGLAHGLALYLLLLPWIGEFVGNMPYIALAITEALYSMGFGLLAARALRLKWGLYAAPFIAVAVEWLRSTWPFGGFAWGRIAWGQVDGPLAILARIAGPTIVTLATMMVAAAVIAVFSKRIRAALVLAVPVAATAMVAHLPTAAPIGEVTVAAVQGNVPRMGLDFNAQRRAVLANHVRETQNIPRQADIVIWPENSSDVNPFRDEQARILVNHAASVARAPILVGTITEDAVGDRNTMVVINPDASVGEHHHKKFLQPFGEYMPMRDFFRRFSPLVDQAGNFQPGDGTGVVHMKAAISGREIPVGISTCYEVAFDASAQDAIAHGAQILTTPTNNATFGFTDMTYQQLAMSRMRAIEMDRAVVVAATSGVSALVSPEGRVLQQSKIFTPAVLEDELPLKDSRTIASRAGSVIAAGFDIIGSLCALAALYATRGKRLRRNPNAA
ncbi:acyltransferase [Corynebacterium aquilae DSM 44791]|uniref:Apolipoprotein N-acyltransferase n=1 Tax=Corynebacterium aquilae DSM 44791 TaxID=1431546 RepID=A0A1L7CFY6_9CORY|nr:acyltransferase [Corynebacterium aquilae DSM 44791]